MGGMISLKDQFLWVSNQRLSTLLDFALQVSEEAVRSDEERGWFERLRQFESESWPGIDFDLDEQFPTVEEKKFWAPVFHNVARRIFLRQLGNQEITFWQSSAIGDAYIIARMLTRAVQEVELGWASESENSREAAEFYGRINIRV
jgi:hypothetical protein